MPLTNGDVAEAPGLRKDVLDHTRALEILKSDYSQGDGLDALSLLDSAKHGALTYNDFLVLPGYIGRLIEYTVACGLTILRFCCFRCTT